MKNTNLTTEENLALIAKSIQQTKNNLYEQRFYYLFWGWLVLATSLAHSLLAYLEIIVKPYLVWPVLMGAGFIITLGYGYASSRKTGRVESLLDRSLKHLWIILGISFFRLLDRKSSLSNRSTPDYSFISGNRYLDFGTADAIQTPAVGWHLLLDSCCHFDIHHSPAKSFAL